jgi:ribosomal protein S18 acetylase RimI-like enzyme
MSAQLERLRRLHGASTAIWGGPDVRVEEGRWVALSGVPAVDFNVVLLHADSGRRAVPQALEEIAAAQVPALVFVAGAALGEVQQLIDASWVCVGVQPLMSLELDRLDAQPLDAAVRRLDRTQLAAARAVVGEVFDYEPSLTVAAIPDETVDAPGRSVWAVVADDGTLCSVAATMVVEDVISVWSMATPRAHRRQGHASRLLRGVFASAREEGVQHCVLSASTDGEPLYRALGFVELERWQQWSRRRWVFSRQ